MGVSVLLLFQSENLSEGIRRGLFICSYSVIPSLFPFMAVSVFICKSSVGEFFGRAFSPLAGALKIPKGAVSALLASVIGGYPAGAKCINDLVLRGGIPPKTAAFMLCYCVNAGPAFLISAVGVGVFGNIKIGVLIFFAQILSAVLTAAATVFFLKKPPQNSESVSFEGSAAAVLVESVISAAESCFRMCAFIVISFGVLETFFAIGAAPENPILRALLTGFFEVTSGVFSCEEIGGFNAVIIAGAVASFSGISVILQVAAVTAESKISLAPFIISRFVHAMLTASILKVIFSFCGDSVSVFSVESGKVEAALSASAPAVVSLLCMASLFLLSVVPPKSEKEPIFKRIWTKFTEIRHRQIR